MQLWFIHTSRGDTSKDEYFRLPQCQYCKPGGYCIDGLYQTPSYIIKRELPIYILGCITHWGGVTHICVGELTIIVSYNGLSPGRRQAIIWTNDWILLIGHYGTNFSEILIIEILTFSFTKMSLKVSSAKWRPFCLGLNVIIRVQLSRWQCSNCGRYGNDDVYKTPISMVKRELCI